MPLTIWIEIWFDGVMSDKDRQSHREPGDSGNSPPPRRPWLLGARLTLVKLVLVWFLMFWPPRYDSPAAARRAGQPRPAAAAAEKELTLKDDDPWQSGQGAGRRAVAGVGVSAIGTHSPGRCAGAGVVTAAMGAWCIPS